MSQTLKQKWALQTSANICSKRITPTVFTSTVGHIPVGLFAVVIFPVELNSVDQKLVEVITFVLFMVEKNIVDHNHVGLVSVETNLVELNVGRAENVELFLVEHITWMNR